MARKPAYRYEATLLRVLDGDTVKLGIEMGRMDRLDQDLGLHLFVKNKRLVLHLTARLHGRDAPESKTPAGLIAKQALSARLPVGVACIARTHRDKAEKYGRFLVDLTPCAGVLAGQDVSTWMIENGYALRYDGRGPRPVHG